MEYKNKNFNIYGYPIKKFKTIGIRVVFTTNVNKRDFVLSDFLLALLTYTNNNFHTNREFTMSLQDLYDLYLSSTSMRRGNKLVSTLELNMIDPKYTSKKIMKDSIKVLKDAIFNPYVYDNHFDTDSFNIVKDQFKCFIDSLSDNPQNVVNEKVVSSYPNSNIGITYSVCRKYLDEIDEYKLYEYYKEFLNNREIAIYICGDYNDEMIDILSKFPLKSNKIEYLDNKLIDKEQEPLYLYEDYNQAKLALLMKVENETEFEKKYVSTILNSILGGLQDSLLMESIREEHSLVYYIDSMFYKYDQAIIVYSGCSSDNTDIILKKIDECMKELRNGDFDDAKLDAAITDVLVVLDDYERSPYLILDYIVSLNVLHTDPMGIRIKNYKKVTKQDVMTLAKKIKTMKLVLLRDKNERI